MSGSEDLGSLPQLLADLDEERAIVVVKGALGAGESALATTRAAERGMRLVGQHYEDGTYFLSGLIMAGEIFKNILTTALRGFGFTVEDLGVDVPPEVFLEKVDSFQPDVVGLSGLTSASYKSMRRTVEVLRGSPQQPDGLPIVIGGATVDEEVAAFTHADSWTKDAMEGIRIIQQFVDERRHARPLPASPLD